MKEYHILITDTEDGNFSVAQKAPNGNIINHSEGLTTPLNALKNIIASSRLFGKTEQPRDIQGHVNCLWFYGIKVYYEGSNPTLNKYFSPKKAKKK